MASETRRFNTGLEYCSAPVAAIPEFRRGTLTSSLQVAGEGLLADLDVLVRIEHTFVGDLVTTLHHPDGTSVVLFDRPGVPASTFGCGADNIDAVFDDDAASPAERACGVEPALSGRLSPAQPLAALSDKPIAGQWRLTVSDNAGGDRGILRQWCLWPTRRETPLFKDGFE